MSFVEDLFEICSQYTNDSYYVGAEIPEKKFNNVVTEFLIPSGEEILAVVDATVFGSCKNGLAICSGGMYVNNSWTGRTRRSFISWEEFKYADIGKLDRYEIEVTPNFTINIAGSSMKQNVLMEILYQLQSYLNAGEAVRDNDEASPIPEQQDNQWMLAYDGQQYGPYTTQDVIGMIRSNQLNKDVTYAWKQGMEQWEIVGSLSAFTQQPPSAPPPPISLNVSKASEKELVQEEQIIDLNQASIKDLLGLPGVDLAIAQRFIEERVRRNGYTNYQEVRAMLNVQPHEFEEIKESTKLIALSTGGTGRVIDF
ncbi:GYF domain-containing protein [Metabacillus halosaccharovorans]|uniref:GYF domain-containing protein n=1 Tax=Metabacillus halosaccharovorans TaxID=930124 RepID=UPI00203F6BDF|nr:GYF domain-containing protein [Metabacillus halosaccharovorans]MCM3443106.1 GYF domain-containing protein [Metabacillus halosaccharovorans]